MKETTTVEEVKQKIEPELNAQEFWEDVNLVRQVLMIGQMISTEVQKPMDPKIEKQFRELQERYFKARYEGCMEEGLMQKYQKQLLDIRQDNFLKQNLYVFQNSLPVNKISFLLENFSFLDRKKDIFSRAYQTSPYGLTSDWN